MNKKLFTKTLGLLVACGAVATFGNSALAAPPGSATAGDNMSFSYTVGFECSVDVPSTFTTAGGAVGTNDLPYTANFTTGGANGDIDNGINPALEDRWTSLTANDTTTFDCNSDTVDLSVVMNNVTAPAFTNAQNIDLIAAGGTIGVDHKVSIGLNGNAAAAPLLNISAVTDGATVVSAAGNGLNLPTNLDADLVVNLTSAFVLIGGAEELGAGTYAADFTATVTAN
jgi:hypothetical protein